LSYIGKTPTPAPLTSSDITDGIISLPKLTDGTDGNIISYDASGNPVAVATGSAGQVLTSAGAGAPPTFAAAGGITEADAWRITANAVFSGAGASDVTANWERVDTDSGGIIGTGMTESSGIFSFPSTGIYLVNFDSVVTKDETRVYAGIYIQVSTDGGSSYSVATETFGSIYIANAAAQLHGSFLLDVTSTANIKVRFYAVAAGVTDYDGNTAANRTYATFIRLGDT
jgi:hypothetical protein